MRIYFAVIAALFLIVAMIAFGAVFNRIDKAHEEIRETRRTLRSEIDSVRASIPPKTDTQGITEQLRVCKGRTEWIRIVLETFVPLNDRVRLPDPPPGWNRWPAPNPNE